MIPQPGIVSQRKKAEELAGDTNAVIMRAKGIFPLTLFPDEIIVNKNKVDIIHRHFFFTKTVTSILLADIKTVTVTTGLITSAIYFDIEGYQDDPEAVTHLSRSQAYLVRDTILGMTMLKKEHVNLTDFSTEELQGRADRVGHTPIRSPR